MLLTRSIIWSPSIPEGSHFLKGPFSVPFGVYYMTAEGQRELLAFDWSNSCGQAIPVMPRQTAAGQTVAGGLEPEFRGGFTFRMSIRGRDWKASHEEPSNV